MRTRTAAPEAEEPDPKNAATISRSALMDGKIVPGGGWHMLIGYVLPARYTYTVYYYYEHLLATTNPTRRC
jgi:hypothetical protein